MGESRKDFCINCRKETEYKFAFALRKRTVKGKEYEYKTLIALCSECGEEMSIPGLMDYDNEKFDEAYREAEGLVSIRNIENLMKLYNLGKAPISIALGFGEITITRYLAGQMPSKEYSDIIKHALADPKFMSKLIEQNKEKLGSAAYKKAKAATAVISNDINGISKKMISTIAYIFSKIEEVTPLAMQKLLYFSQGINMGVNKVPLFSDNCEAWAHGPVYPRVYQLFKEFKYNPIDDSRFEIFYLADDILYTNEKAVLESVIESFGMYSGKMLEQITHDEDPWKDARNGLDPTESSNRIISQDALYEFFSTLNDKYDFSSASGINKYINSSIGKNVCNCN